MEKQRILVIDDEPDLCDILLYNLREGGYRADCAYSAEEALGLPIAHYDLLLLDVMLPAMSGFELAAKLKTDSSTSHIPVIFLTAKDAEADTLQGFDIGADDYVTKPFSVRELMARLKAVLGRVAASSPASVAVQAYEGLVLDLKKKTATVDGLDVALTKTEFELLKLLLSCRGQVLARSQMLEQVWPENVVVTERTVDVNIARLRKKIGDYSRCIVARQGYGYMFE